MLGLRHLQLRTGRFCPARARIHIEYLKATHAMQSVLPDSTGFHTLMLSHWLVMALAHDDGLLGVAPIQPHDGGLGGATLAI